MATKKLRSVPLLNLREVYRPGPEVLAYGTLYEQTVTVKARVYGPNNGRCRLDWSRLEPGVFTANFNFRELGNYVFVIEEDGDITTILNAKVYA